MTKYIHKSKKPLADIIVSDSRMASRDGYSMFMEIDISDFQSVFESMNGFSTRLNKIHIKDDGSCNISASSFLHDFLHCLDTREDLSEIPFEIKIHHNGKVVVYSRSVIDK